jgi:hypothetical protein
VSFSYDPGLALNVKSVTLPAVTGTDLPPWELAAETIQFTFEGYPLTGVFHTPHLQVFRAADYAAASPEGGKIVEELKKLLQDKPAESPDKELPFLPVPNAAQMMRAQIRYLDFRGGSGVRFLTQYGQDVSPISNTRMFYTYQGLTQDGQYVVSATFPVSNPVLPDESSITLDQVFMDRFAQYILDTTQALNEQSPESYTPDLGLLDTMIQTLLIQK